MAGYGEDLYDDDLSIMLASSKFAPLQRHPPDMVVPMDCVWKPSSHKVVHTHLNRFLTTGFILFPPQAQHDHLCGSQSLMLPSAAPGGGATTPGSAPGPFSVTTPLGTPRGSCKPGL